MKKNLISVFVCSLVIMLALTGCKNNENNGTEPETLNGNVDKPTWVSDSSNDDFSSSMTAVIKIDLAAQYPALAKDFQTDKNDLLGAFSASGECLGVASELDGLFYLYITGTEGSVTLRYYSGYYKNIFVAKDAFVYKNNDNLGTVAKPFVPLFLRQD